jgi:hypothetical protein
MALEETRAERRDRYHLADCSLASLDIGCPLVLSRAAFIIALSLLAGPATAEEQRNTASVPNVRRAARILSNERGDPHVHKKILVGGTGPTWSSRPANRNGANGGK